MLNRLATKYLLPLVAGGLLIFAVVFVRGQGQTTEPARPAIAPPQTPFAHTVAGAGLVEAETENIAIGSPTSGAVVEAQSRALAHAQAGCRAIAPADGTCTERPCEGAGTSTMDLLRPRTGALVLQLVRLTAAGACSRLR